MRYFISNQIQFFLGQKGAWLGVGVRDPKLRLYCVRLQCAVGLFDSKESSNTQKNTTAVVAELFDVTSNLTQT